MEPPVRDAGMSRESALNAEIAGYFRLQGIAASSDVVIERPVMFPGPILLDVHLKIGGITVALEVRRGVVPSVLAQGVRIAEALVAGDGVCDVAAAVLVFPTFVRIDDALLVWRYADDSTGRHHRGRLSDLYRSLRSQVAQFVDGT